MESVDTLVAVRTTSGVYKRGAIKMQELHCSAMDGSAKPAVPYAEALDSVVVGISTFGPVVSWLFRGICNPGIGLHILQAKFHGHQQTEWCSMIHS